MRASSTIYLAAAAALAGLPTQVSAFSNTSPFFLITTSELSKASTSTSTLSTSQFIEIAKDVISQCNSDEYVIATQPGVHASDFRNGHAGIFRGEDDGLPGMPHLKRALHEDGEKGQLVVPFARNAEVNGQVVGGEYVAKVLGDWAREKCGAEMVEVDASTGAFERFGDMKPKVMMVKFEELDGGDVEERAKALADADAFLFSLVDSLPNSRYTLIYTSTPRARVPNLSPLKSQTAHIPQDEPELRRRSLETNKDKDKNATIPDGSIFQRYAFFTPGVWMGYIAAFFLLSIVYAGLSALTSLKVSYAAFEKEMGPAAAKKQQ